MSTYVFFEVKPDIFWYRAFSYKRVKDFNLEIFQEREESLFVSLFFSFFTSMLMVFLPMF